MTHELSLQIEMEVAREKVKTGEWKLRKYTNRKAIYTFDSHKTGTTNMARYKCGLRKPSLPSRAASGQPRPQTIDAFMRPDHTKIPLLLHRPVPL